MLFGYDDKLKLVLAGSLAKKIGTLLLHSSTPQIKRLGKIKKVKKDIDRSIEGLPRILVRIEKLFIL